MREPSGPVAFSETCTSRSRAGGREAFDGKPVAIRDFHQATFVEADESPSKPPA
jgi:hypothetical protein